MRWNVPNILTVFRLFAALGVPLCYIIFPSPYADWLAVALFVSASLTDYLDGYLARKWNQISKFGKMLDPIADKAMVVIALTVVVALSGMNIIILIPVTIILFREIFISGLREFLGVDASELKVTKLAKWKTTIQMVAIAGILLSFSFWMVFDIRSHAMDYENLAGVMNGELEDIFNLRLWSHLYFWCYNISLGLLWLAALLTMVTGIDYFIKALPYLREDD